MFYSFSGSPSLVIPHVAPRILWQPVDRPAIDLELLLGHHLHHQHYKRLSRRSPHRLLPLLPRHLLYRVSQSSPRPLRRVLLPLRSSEPPQWPPLRPLPPLRPHQQTRRKAVVLIWRSVTKTTTPKRQPSTRLSAAPPVQAIAPRENEKSQRNIAEDTALKSWGRRRTAKKDRGGGWVLTSIIDPPLWGEATISVTYAWEFRRRVFESFRLGTPACYLPWWHSRAWKASSTCPGLQIEGFLCRLSVQRTRGIFSALGLFKNWIMTGE